MLGKLRYAPVFTRRVFFDLLLPMAVVFTVVMAG